MNRLLSPLAVGAAAWLLVACGGGDSSGAAPGDGSQAGAQQAASSYRTAAPEGAAASRIDARLRGAQGQVRVWVSLEQNSVAAQRAALAEADVSLASDRMAIKSASALRAGVNAHKLRISETQGTLSGQLSALGGKELARVQTAHNAIAVSIDASQLTQVASLSGVAKVRPVMNYELDLSRHRALCGRHRRAIARRRRHRCRRRGARLGHRLHAPQPRWRGHGRGLRSRPTARPLPTRRTRRSTACSRPPRSIDGYDFVGESWPNSPEVGDPDPIDLEGHGTHVGDIIAGKSLDGTHKGVAPGAKLMAVKVCSAVATSCSGIALLQGMDFALDPNGDGDTSDAVDVINMSLGSSYGQTEDDLTLAASNAVGSAWWSSPRPATAPTSPTSSARRRSPPGSSASRRPQMPSAVADPAGGQLAGRDRRRVRNTQTMDWAPIDAAVSGDVVFYGRGCPAGSVRGGLPGRSGAGQPARQGRPDRPRRLLGQPEDRPCRQGRRDGVLIGLVAGGDAVSFSYGGGDTFVPSMVIQQSLSHAIKANIAAPVNVTISPAAGIPLIGSMAATSSRGPSMSTQAIKPEIGAPGASLSAEAGTGTGETVFGGTSGAAPMVVGRCGPAAAGLPEPEARADQGDADEQRRDDDLHQPCTASGTSSHRSRASARVRCASIVHWRSPRWPTTASRSRPRCRSARWMCRKR